jgi:hypothetical protein
MGQKSFWTSEKEFRGGKVFSGSPSSVCRGGNSPRPLRSPSAEGRILLGLSEPRLPWEESPLGLSEMRLPWGESLLGLSEMRLSWDASRLGLSELRLPWGEFCSASPTSVCRGENSARPLRPPSVVGRILLGLSYLRLSWLGCLADSRNTDGHGQKPFRTLGAVMVIDC